MRADYSSLTHMELRVWVGGVQRTVGGVTENTSCRDVVFALAQAIGRAGRYTLLETWQGLERPLAPSESPLAVLKQWGRFSSDVQLVLQRTGSALTPSGQRRSLPSPPRLRSYGHGCEPGRRSLVLLDGAVRGLLEMGRLVQFQRHKVRLLQEELGHREAELRVWAGRVGGGAEAWSRFRRIRGAMALMEEEAEEQHWEERLQEEQQNQEVLMERLAELRRRMQDCEEQRDQYLSRIPVMRAGLEAERRQQQVQLQLVQEELDVQAEESVRLESACRAAERLLDQSNLSLQERELELESLTRELRQVNLQQFIQQTSSRASHSGLQTGGSLQRAGLNNHPPCKAQGVFV